MRKINTTVTCILLASLAIVGCGSDEGDGADDSNDAPEMIATSGGASLMVYDDPYAPDMPGTPNPIPETAGAAADAFDVGGKLRIRLVVARFPPDRTFGSHLHKLPCDDPTKAGGHYQHMPFPTGGMATDPDYANATNEAWLDFTTDSEGNALTDLTLDWLPRSEEAKGIIIHNMASGVGGVSGPKLACLPIAGF